MSEHHVNPAHHSAPYETTDADAKQISIWTITIFVTIAIGMISMAVLLVGFLKFPPSLDRTPTDAEYQRSLPPAPRLQVNEPGDLHQFRAREEHILSTYGRESNSGAVRIPIDKAIDIVASKGALPGVGKPVAVAAPKPAAAKK